MLNKNLTIIILIVFVLYACHSLAATSVDKKVSKNPKITKVSTTDPTKESLPSRQSHKQLSKKTDRTQLKQKSFKGFCCVNGKVQKNKTTNSECKTRNGNWYSSQEEAKKRCHKNYSRPKGKDTRNRNLEKIAVIKNRQKSTNKPSARLEQITGFCNVKSRTLPNITETKCRNLKGTFFDKSHLAHLAIMREKQRKVRTEQQIRTRNIQLSHSKKAYYKKTEKPAQVVTTVSPELIRKLDQNNNAQKLYLPEKGATFRTPLFGQSEDGMYNPLFEDLRTPLPEGVDHGKLPGWGNFGLPPESSESTDQEPQRDGLVDRAREIWDRPGIHLTDLAGVLLWLHSDNDIDQNGANDLAGGSDELDSESDFEQNDDDGSDWLSDAADRVGEDIEDVVDTIAATIENLVDDMVSEEVVPDGQELTQEEIRELINTSSNDTDGNGNSSSGGSSDDDGTSDDDDDDDDDSDEQDESDDSGNTDDEDEDQEESTEDTDDATDQRSGGDRGRGGTGPSLLAEISDDISVDLRTGRKKHEKLTGGGNNGGHVSTPLTQPGKGDEHQKDVPDIQTTPESNISPGIGVAVHLETPNPPGVGPTSQPGVDDEGEGPLIILTDKNPVQIPDGVIIDDPRVEN